MARSKGGPTLEDCGRPANHRGTIDFVVERQVMPILTSRLVLQPVTRELARAVVSGRISDLRVGPGWPHADTADAMAMALAADPGPSWVIILDGVVIGDCGAFSWPDEDGVVEIGYGLAEPFRGHGYATEAARATCRWLFSEARATAIIATDVDVDNVASSAFLRNSASPRSTRTSVRFPTASNAAEMAPDEAPYGAGRTEPQTCAGSHGRPLEYGPTAAPENCGWFYSCSVSDPSRSRVNVVSRPHIWNRAWPSTRAIANVSRHGRNASRYRSSSPRPLSCRSWPSACHMRPVPGTPSSPLGTGPSG